MSAGPTGSHSRRGSSSSRRSVDSVEKLELQDYGSPSLGQAPHRQHELPGTLFSLPRPALTCAALYLTFGCICDGIQFNSQLTSQTFTSPLLSTTLALTTTAITAFVGPKLVQKVPSWQGSSTEWLGTGALPSPKRWSAGLGLLLAFAQLGWATGASVLPFHILESLPVSSALACPEKLAEAQFGAHLCFVNRSSLAFAFFSCPPFSVCRLQPPASHSALSP